MSSVKRRMLHAANRALDRFGVELVTRGEIESGAARLTSLIDGLYAVYSEHIFSELPSCDGRLELVRSLIGTEVPEAMFLLHHLHGALASGDGDVVEMGIAQGATSALLANEIRKYAERSLWLYDSFEGLSQPTDEDVLIDDMENRGSMGAYAGAMANPRRLVEGRLDAIAFPVRRTKIVHGFIDDQMPVPELVAFAYLDFDLYTPILTGLTLLHPHTRPGTVLMVDDYGYFSSGVAAAVKEFLNERANDYDLLEAPSYGGHFCALVRR